MSEQEQPPFTIEQFCKWASQGKPMGGRCVKCGKVHFPPRPLCDVCFGDKFEWFEIPKQGKLLTYTIIHVAPAQFQSLAPYAVAIAEFAEGLKLPGMIKNAPVEAVKIGMPLTIVIEASCGTSGQWPQWPRYYFTPV